MAGGTALDGHGYHFLGATQAPQALQALPGGFPWPFPSGLLDMFDNEIQLLWPN